tara:strand:+ start:391 stop:531 length:141 start_codon:yes stop_codon:yes gene_type:complete
MIDINEIKNEINTLKNDVRQNYDKLLNIYIKLVIELMYFEKTDEDL